MIVLNVVHVTLHLFADVLQVGQEKIVLFQFVQIIVVIMDLVFFLLLVFVMVHGLVMIVDHQFVKMIVLLMEFVD